MAFRTIYFNPAEHATCSLRNNVQHSYKSRTLGQQYHERKAYLPIFPNQTVVDESIILFNADRLHGICYILLSFHESFRRHVLEKKDVALKEPTLNSNQMAIALEFYLQIDVVLLYMKTCSFRGAEPRSKIEGLFCGTDEPQASYTMLPCGSLFCTCCHTVNSYKKSQPWPVIDFASSSMHRFINGYKTYLNCPATCTTVNVVYAMTCPCGNYDFVDSTANALAEAMAYHRELGNRIIHEKLTGSAIFERSMLEPKIVRQNIILKQMRLYQHSARCPVALQLFLDCTPIYWCFIPLPRREALLQDFAYLKGIHVENFDLAFNVLTSTTHERNVEGYLSRVPLTPTGFIVTKYFV
ncbi:unnamed protein product [Rotaria magnacalcarata]|uniref:Uncharacterized protein n=2 Tax=Rotaria magnacalcarata TaxID=392030 RepID=A0A816V3J0_9BILA|nr:unnamed protein product [Rotaria magnacalcarata]